MNQNPLSKLPPPSYLQGSAQRVEAVQKMNQIQERFNQPKIKLVKSPWEAALEGSVENAFQEMRQSPRGFVTAPTPTTLKRLTTPPPPSPPVSTTPDLYKPKAPRAWNPQPTCKTFNDEIGYKGAVPYTQQESYSRGEKQPQSPPSSLSYSGLNNFNTAPRGWQKSMSYYRPVTFNAAPAAYTDF